MNKPQRILILGDRAGTATALSGVLSRAGFEVKVVAGVAEAEAAPDETPGLLLLDVRLPVLDAVQTGLELRATAGLPHLPMVIVGRGSDPAEKILALEGGADDYLASPYDPRELVARIHALLRRSALSPPADPLRAGGIELDPERYTVSVRGAEVTLTSKEFGLLRALLEARGRVVRREELLEDVWSYGRAAEIESRTLDVHVRRLRKKLGPEGSRIVTVRSVGFRMDIVPSARHMGAAREGGLPLPDER